MVTFLWGVDDGDTAVPAHPVQASTDALETKTARQCVTIHLHENATRQFPDV
jgi:hypothetical protein